MKDFWQAYNDLSKEQVPYYRQYTHDSPMVMSLATYSRTEQLGKVLHKVICYFAEHYAEWLAYMPLSERDLEILAICSKYPFKAGTYRADFVITPDNKMKIIEFSTRFPLNGFILSGFTNQIGLTMANDLSLFDLKDTYSPFLDYLSNYFSPTGRITVIKGNDRMGDFKTYSRLFKESFDFQIIEVDDLHNQRTKLENATLIEELNFDEIRSLPNNLIEELCTNGILNDFRNLFLIHDKRFLSMLTLSVFLEQCLTKVEQDLLTEFTIPSYTYIQSPEVFQLAFSEKNNWIIKPSNLGKSVGIIAGCTVTEDYWKMQFNSGVAQQCVLQPMVPQRKYEGTIGNEHRDDYVVGTLLYMDGVCYGPGIYRASSFIVTNQRDDRKMAQIVANVDIHDKCINVL